jgi:hypothetical protein
MLRFKYVVKLGLGEPVFFEHEFINAAVRDEGFLRRSALRCGHSRDFVRLFRCRNHSERAGNIHHVVVDSLRNADNGNVKTALLHFLGDVLTAAQRTVPADANPSKQ